MATPPTPPSTSTTPTAPAGNDHAGINASTMMLDKIFGGVTGQPRDQLGRFARVATNAPSSESMNQDPAASKRVRFSEDTAGEHEGTTAPEPKRQAVPGLESALVRTPGPQSGRVCVTTQSVVTRELGSNSIRGEAPDMPASRRVFYFESVVAINSKTLR